MSSIQSVYITQVNNDCVADLTDSRRDRNVIKFDPNGNLVQNSSASSFASSSSYEEEGSSSNSDSKADDSESEDILKIKTR